MPLVQVFIALAAMNLRVFEQAAVRYFEGSVGCCGADAASTNRLPESPASTAAAL